MYCIHYYTNLDEEGELDHTSYIYSENKENVIKELECLVDDPYVCDVEVYELVPVKFKVEKHITVTI